MESLKNNLFSSTKNGKDWKKNSLGEIVSEENIDSYIKKIDLDEANEKLNGILKWKESDKQWQDYFKELGSGNDYIKELIKNTKDLSKLEGQDLVDACDNARKSVIAHNKELENMYFKAKAGKVAIGALATAGNMLAMWLVSKGLELAIESINDFIHASEIAREKSSELTESWTSENSNIDDTINKYEELKEKLNNTTLSASEVKTVKENLLEVQNDLIDKYGQEALGIDLVNGKYDEQITKLEELSKKKAEEYVAKNYADIQADKKYISEEVVVSESLGFSGSMLNPHDYSDAGFDLGKFLEKYDKLDTAIEEKSGHSLNGIVKLVARGTREEIYGQLVDLSNEIRHELGTEDENVNKFREILSDIINESFDIEQIEKSKSNIKEYAKAEILSNSKTRKLYDEATIAVEKYNKALQSGDGVETARKNLDEVKQGVNAMTSDIYGATDIFDEIYNGINSTAEKSYEISKYFNDDDSVVDYAKQLKGLSEDDLLKINFDDNVKQPGEEAFSSLIDIIGVSSEETQLLIDKLVELGYVQGSITEGSMQGKPFSDRFQSLWDSEGFSSAQENLMKLSREAGITSKDILSLARENSELSTLLDESSMSAQFAATCFQRVCDGADGFSAITDDALALDQILHEMDGSLQMATASKSAYDKAMSQDDYNAEFKNYQDAYKSAMEMFENGDYGKHFRSAMEYLLGDESYTMSIEELKSSMDGLKNVFGEDSTNGLEFLDKLYEKKDILDGMDSSLKKLSDGSYDFDLKPDEFEKIGDALGMTKEEVAACTNALGMFGDYASYDIGKLEDKLKGISVAAKDGKDSLLSLQGVESMLSNLGYNGYEIYHIMQDIQGMDGIKLIDFSADDKNSLDSIVSQLKELDMIEINGDSINVESLIDNLRNSFNMTSEDIKSFITNINRDFDFKDAEGKALSLNGAIEKVQTSENDETAESIHEVGTELDDATDKAQELDSQKTTGIQGEFVNLKSRIFSVTQEIVTAMGKIDELNNKKLPDITGSTGGANGGSVLKGAGGKTIKGTVNKILKKGKADASGNIGVKSDETALVNELGNETVIDPKSGTYEVIEGGAQFRKLKKGQIVLNHLQTKALLAKGKIQSFGKMMFNGNAALKGKSYAFGTAGGKNPATKKPYGNKNNDKSGSSKDAKDAKEETQKEFSEIFDWIERRIKKFQRAFDKWVKQAETAVTSNFVNKYYKKAQSSAKSQLSTYGKAYNRYMREANAVGLDEKYAKKVRNGTIDIEEIRAKGTEEEVKKYEELVERIKEYQDWCNNYALLSGNRQENSI